MALEAAVDQAGHVLLGPLLEGQAVAVDGDGHHAAEVVAVDIVDEKLEWATKLGAKATLNANEFERIDKEIRKLTNGGADIGFEAIGNPDVQKQTFF